MPAIGYGLDISDHSAELAIVSRKRGTAVLECVAQTEIPPGAISRGVIIDADAVANALRPLLLKACGPRAKMNVTVAIPDALVFAKTFVLPAKLENSLAVKAAANQAREELPIAFDDILAAVQPFAPQQENKDIYYAVVDRPHIEKYREVLRKIGAEVAAFDAEALALARAVLPPDIPGPVMIADIGAKATTVIYADRGGVRMHSNLPVGGDQLTAALEVKLNLPLEKAELLKRAVGFDPAKEEGRYFFIMQGPMTEIVEEIRREAEFAERRYGRKPLALVLAGGTSLAPSIPDYFQSNFPDLKIAVGNPFAKLEIAPALDKGTLTRTGVLYAVAIGLAMRGAGISGYGGALSFTAEDTLTHTSDESLMARARAMYGNAMHTFSFGKGGDAAAKVRAPTNKFLLALVAIFALAAVGVAGNILYRNVQTLRGRGAAPAPVAAVPKIASATFEVAAVVSESSVLAGREIAVDVESSREFVPSGPASTGGTAHGTVIMFNKTDRVSTLSAGTRLMSEPGQLFRLKNTTTIPARGSVAAEAAADQPGAAGNIGPSAFTVVAFSPAQQQNIYGQSEQAMTGGGSVKSVTQADISAAKQALSDQLKSAALERLKTLAAAGERIMSELMVLEELSSTMPEPGVQVTAFKASMKLQARVLALPENVISAKLMAQLRAGLPPEKSGAQFALEEISYVVVSFNAGDMSATIRAESVVREQ